MASNSVKDFEIAEKQSVDLSDSDGVPLDEEYLSQLEELAKNRYTDEDEDYKRINEKPLSTPPILEGFQPRNSNRGYNRYQNRGGSYKGRNERYQRYDEPRHHHSSSNNYDEPRHHQSSSNSYHRDRSYDRSFENR